MLLKKNLHDNKHKNINNLEIVYKKRQMWPKGDKEII